MPEQSSGSELTATETHEVQKDLFCGTPVPVSESDAGNCLSYQSLLILTKYLC